MTQNGEKLDLDEMSPSEILAGLPEAYDPYEVYAVANRQLTALDTMTFDRMFDKRNFPTVGEDYLNNVPFESAQWTKVAGEAIKYTELPFPDKSLEY